jgi:RNA polymerase sigma-70 factor (ECF subfamily)
MSEQTETIDQANSGERDAAFGASRRRGVRKKASEWFKGPSMGPSGEYGKTHRSWLENVREFVEQYATTKKGLNRDDGGDIAQTIVGALWCRRQYDKRYLGGSIPVVPYLCRLADWRIADFYRQGVVAEFEDLDEDVQVEAIDSWANPEAAQREEELREIVKGVVREMPKERLRVFLLIREQGKTYEEAAQATGKSRDTIRNLLVAANKELRRALAGHDVLPEESPGHKLVKGRARKRRMSLTRVLAIVWKGRRQKEER